MCDILQDTLILPDLLTSMMRIVGLAKCDYTLIIKYLGPPNEAQIRDIKKNTQALERR